MDLRETRTITITRRIVLAAALCAFAVILICVLNGNAACFDDPVREFFYGLRGPALTKAMVVITNSANALFIIALCIVLLIVPQTRKTFGVPLSIGALGVTIINRIVKHIVMRPRPEVEHLVTEHGYSFTSGHSITSMFFYGMAIWLVWRYVKSKTVRWVLTVLLAIPMLLVGPTRVYLGVHYPTDVLGGWCLGIAAIIVTIEIIHKVEE